MLKTVCVLTGLLLALAVVPLRAQDPLAGLSYNWLDDPYQRSYLDVPADGAIVRSHFLWLSGWALQCVTGQQPPILEVSYEDDNGLSVPLTPWYRTGLIDTRLRDWRPDVSAAFRPWCPAVSDYLGFGFGVTPAVQPGWRTLTLLWRDRTGRHSLRRQILVVP